MRRRDWWIGVGLVVAGLVLHAFYPRYEWRHTAAPSQMIRVDTWTGEATVHSLRTLRRPAN